MDYGRQLCAYWKGEQKKILVKFCNFKLIAK